MERCLLKLILGIAIMSICLPVFSQVKLSDSGDTKFYENGTRITYFKMADFPNSPEMREFVSKMILENPDVNRVTIYRNGETFMYEALQSIDPEMIVDAVNDALKEYREQNGDFPPASPQDYEKQPSNVKVTKHPGNVTTVKVSESPEMRVSQEKNSEKKSSDLHAVPVNAQPVNQQSAENSKNSKRAEQASSANYNENGKNK